MINIISKPVTLPRIVDVYRDRCIVTGGPLGESHYTVRGLVTNGTDNPKTAKINANSEVIVKCISMLPAKLGGIGNLCPHADDCVNSCLTFTGRGAFPSTHYARAARTIAFQLAREWSLERIRLTLRNSQRRADKLKTRVICRPNMLSDYPWETTGIIDEFPRIEFYDYTKNPKRFGAVRDNYWVTFSRGSDNDNHVQNVLAAGGNVAMVFHHENGKCGWRAHQQPLPCSVRIAGKSYPVLDGGITDYRPSDPRSKLQGGKCYTPYIVGLRLLAFTRDKRQTAIDSGFSIQYPNWNDVRVAGTI